MDVRKTVIIKESIESDSAGQACAPITPCCRCLL